MEPGNNGNAIQKATEEGKGEVILSLLVSYNGEPFAGFARQPGQLTVQGSIEEALGLVFRRPIETVCAGRTDSGVHARGQVVSFSLSEEELACRSEFKLLRSLNALTHEDSRCVVRAAISRRVFPARCANTSTSSAPMLISLF